MSSKDGLSSCDINLVSNDSSLWIRGQKLAETIVVTTLFQHEERDSLLTFVVWHLEVFLVEKLIEMIRIKSENVSNTLSPQVLGQFRCFDLVLILNIFNILCRHR